jgi:glyoxylase-like metal-dependent hydrolase (beta-lactamase superfamily II)
VQFQRLEFEGMLVRTAALGPFATNAYVVGCAATHSAGIIDPSNEAGVIEAMLDDAPALTVAGIFQTHAHIDHVAAIPGVRSRHPDLPIHLHPDELPVYQSAPAQGRMFGIGVEAMPKPDVDVAEGDTITIGELEARVLHTPGHTPGGVCYHFEAQGVLFTGDLLFAGSIGRTDFPGGNVGEIKASLARVSGLPDDTIVLSGHGPQTTIGREKRSNPFLRGGW